MLRYASGRAIRFELRLIPCTNDRRGECVVDVFVSKVKGERTIVTYAAFELSCEKSLPRKWSELSLPSSGIQISLRSSIYLQPFDTTNRFSNSKGHSLRTSRLRLGRQRRHGCPVRGITPIRDHGTPIEPPAHHKANADNFLAWSTKSLSSRTIARELKRYTDVRYIRRSALETQKHAKWRQEGETLARCVG